MFEMIVAAIVLIEFIALLLYCPIFKPWFGFRKPKNHPGKWGE